MPEVVAQEIDWGELLASAAVFGIVGAISWIAVDRLREHLRW